MRKVAQRLSSQTNKNLDYQLLLVVFGLIIVGLIIVYDVSVVQAFKDYGDKYVYIKQQLIWMVLGLASLFFFSRFSYQHLRQIALPFFIFSVILLLAVFIPGLGISAGGAHRWLKIGPVSVQPAEIVKLTSIIFFASLFERSSQERTSKFKIGPFAIILFTISVIIGGLQKDLGSTIVFFLTSIAMYIIANGPLYMFIGLAPISLISFLIFTFSSTYRKQRILAFLDPFSDPQGYSYQISQVLIALGSGGIFGLGLGQSRQKFEYIPEVTTDSIFAIIGEEFGFIGATFLICLISFLVYRGFKIAEHTYEPFGRLLAFGLTSWLGVQTIVNLGAMVSLIPLTGVPLPFISYGGSALLANLVAVGILLNISKSSKI